MKRLLLISTLAAAAVPALAVGAPGDKLSLKGSPNPVVFGKAVSFSGKLTGKNHDGKAVQLEADAFPYDGVYQVVATATTAANGDWSATHTPVRNTRYRARQGSTLSAVLTELVRLRVSRRVSDATPERGQLIRFSGRACPEHDGALVRIQRLSSTGRWITVRRTVLRDIPGSTCSRYTRRFRVYRDTTFRVVASSGDADHVRGISRRKRVDVHR